MDIKKNMKEVLINNITICLKLQLMMKFINNKKNSIWFMIVKIFICNRTLHKQALWRN